VIAGSAVKDRSEVEALSIPRGPVEFARQQWRSHRPDSRWEWVWIARRRGQVDWRQAPGAREEIRQATLVAAGKQPAWLAEAAGRAERELSTPPVAADAEAEDGTDAS
jgi:hypothetical protein